MTLSRKAISEFIGTWLCLENRCLVFENSRLSWVFKLWWALPSLNCSGLPRGALFG